MLNFIFCCGGSTTAAASTQYNASLIGDTQEDNCLMIETMAPLPSSIQRDFENQRALGGTDMTGSIIGENSHKADLIEMSKSVLQRSMDKVEKSLAL
jgi:hypothetical protein